MRTEEIKLEFDLEEVMVTEFGVVLEDVVQDDKSEEGPVVVPVNKGVQETLREMVQATLQAMRNHGEGPQEYEPSEQYGSMEYLYFPLNKDLIPFMYNLHQATNFKIFANVLEEPSKIFCYFARFIDKQERRLTALRRAAQFKGLLKSKNRLARLVDDTLTIIEDTVFKLDNDFDILVDNTTVHILRPASFESIGRLQESILSAASKNIETIKAALSFVDFSGIEAYACEHPRAARYLASICAQGGLKVKGISKSRLKSLCEATGVEISESEGMIVVAKGHEMAFLEVLDRRRYEVDLVEGSPERYRALSRKKVN